MKKNKVYIIIILLTIFLLAMYEYNKPKPINWQPTFSTYDNIPFGTFVLYELIEDIFSNKKIERINKTFYAFKPEYNDFTMIYIASNVHINGASRKKLFEHVSDGNEVLISAYNIDRKLLDTLGIEIKTTDVKLTTEPKRIYLEKTSALIDTSANYPYLFYAKAIEIQNNNYPKKALGTIDKHTNFIKISVGKGHFFIHTEPMAFANYHLLKRNSYQYCENLLNKLECKNIVWSDYPNNGLRQNNSPLRYIYTQKALKYAYFTLLMFVILYMLLGGRRKQKVIPQFAMPTNSSIDFIQNISNLYYSKKKHNLLANYKLNTLKIYLKEKYFLIWENDLNHAFKTKLFTKIDLNNKEINELFSYIKQLENNKELNAKQLIKYNMLINKITKYGKYI